MSITNKQICAIFYEETDQGKFSCLKCVTQLASTNGYSNLISHLLKMHTSYEQEAREILHSGFAIVTFIPQRFLDIFRWIEWTVMQRRPISFCENKYVRKNTSLSPISSDTLRNYTEKLCDLVDDNVQAVLSAKFGVVLDGWTSGDRHFVAIFAVFCDSTGRTGSLTSSCIGGCTSSGIRVRTSLAISSSTGSELNRDVFEDAECCDRNFLLLASSGLNASKRKLR